MKIEHIIGVIVLVTPWLMMLFREGVKDRINYLTHNSDENKRNIYSIMERIARIEEVIKEKVHAADIRNADVEERLRELEDKV